MLRCACLLGGPGALTTPSATALFCYELVHVSLLPRPPSPFAPPISGLGPHSSAASGASCTALRSRRTSRPARHLATRPCRADAPPENHRPRHAGAVGCCLHPRSRAGFLPALQSFGARADRANSRDLAMDGPRRTRPTRTRSAPGAAPSCGVGASCACRPVRRTAC